MPNLSFNSYNQKHQKLKTIENETITLAAMLSTMDSGQTFSIGFRTCNLTKDTGGEWIEFEKCIKSGFQMKQDRRENRPSGEAEKIHRNPQHYENATRNIMRTDSGDIMKVHIRLIRKFNGKTVL